MVKHCLLSYASRLVHAEVVSCMGTQLKSCMGKAYYASKNEKTTTVYRGKYRMYIEWLFLKKKSSQYSNRHTKTKFKGFVLTTNFNDFEMCNFPSVTIMYFKRIIPYNYLSLHGHTLAERFSVNVATRKNKLTRLVVLSIYLVSKLIRADKVLSASWVTNIKASCCHKHQMCVYSNWSRVSSARLSWKLPAGKSKGMELILHLNCCCFSNQKEPLAFCFVI